MSATTCFFGMKFHAVPIGSDRHLRKRPSCDGRTWTFPRDDAGTLLRDLEQAHESLVIAINDLGPLTGARAPTLKSLTEAGWKLSKASLSRRLLWQKILLYLSPKLTEEGGELLRDLQQADLDLLRASTRHVSLWNADSILDNWDGYRDASRKIRERMGAGIEIEREFLYPLLGSLAFSDQAARASSSAVPVVPRKSPPIPPPVGM